MIIAIDGPAGAGKSTVCRLLAQALGFTYLDTGSMYRAIAWALLRAGFSPDGDLSEENISLLPLTFDIEKGTLAIFSEGRRLGDELRAPEITRYASRMSQVPSIRSFLTRCQRELAGKGGVVAEGRDMTTVVFPDAAVKVFLTADLSTRARRRYAEYQAKGIPMDYSTLEAQIRARDAADQERAIAPLKAAPDALVVDTSCMAIPEVVDHLLRWIETRRRPSLDIRAQRQI